MPSSVAGKKFKAAGKASAREVLEYVCWIADAEKLYEFALTTYDIDLVLMVAELTQRVLPISQLFTNFP